MHALAAIIIVDLINQNHSGEKWIINVNIIAALLYIILGKIEGIDILIRKLN